MKVPERQKTRILTSQAEMARAVAAARRREKGATKIRHARYDVRGDAVVSELSTGSILAVPRRIIPGFAGARPAVLTDLEITPGNEGLWSDNADDGVLLEQLVVLAAGERTVGAIGARINASKKSPARAAASRANGTKGGRPRKSAA
ncbi:MAG: DUF2442 domain-containing protein [Xanthobacteraceae bacterium]